MNVLVVSGNIGRDAEVRNAGGTSVAGFSLAVKSGYGDKAQTVWVDCSLWGKQAESGLVQYLKKGQFVVVTGELGTREHEGKTYVTLRVNNVTLGGKQDAQKSAQGQQRSKAISNSHSSANSKTAMLRLVAGCRDRSSRCSSRKVAIRTLTSKSRLPPLGFSIAQFLTACNYGALRPIFIDLAISMTYL